MDKQFDWKDTLLLHIKQVWSSLGENSRPIKVVITVIAMISLMEIGRRLKQSMDRKYPKSTHIVHA